MKKRIAIIYSTDVGRNDGPPLFYFHQLEKYKAMEIKRLRPDGDYEREGKFDLYFHVDYGEDAIKDMLPYKLAPCINPSVYVASDTHLDGGYRLQHALEHTWSFFNQRQALDEFIKLHPERKDTAFWLPHAFEPECYRPGVWDGQKWIDAVPKKKWDVCFIGHLQETNNYNNMNRVDFMDRMFKEFPNFYYGSRNPMSPGHCLFDDAAYKYNQSKIVLNITIKDDHPNMRDMEVLGTGSFLLTNWTPSLDEVFKDGVHLVTFKTYDEAVEKAKYYLEHEDERDKIARQGYEESKKHTYAKRIEEIFEKIKFNTIDEKLSTN